ncbi:hypothetical protein HacjB3_04150 [Halalkalicoccus jeotgali B3]|uniref:Uncharacterized protein n=1 Tax=Halalkalicoccus jeotgali (strain DSM 18796 / CECT 7217 / JCM 14584 / KCTC 4019 / B3) TaxID=795797 RepID=D8J8N6_HALJB|nr:hypothetical protein HacjB3_04150 [Halalkalicoccus jeotgali B3]
MNIAGPTESAEKTAHASAVRPRRAEWANTASRTGSAIHTAYRVDVCYWSDSADASR